MEGLRSSEWYGPDDRNGYLHRAFEGTPRRIHARWR